MLFLFITFQIINLTMSDSSDQFSASTADGLSQLFSLSQEAPTARNPFEADPSFESEEEMKKYLNDIGQKDIFLSPENIEIETSDRRNLSCDCGHCVGIKMGNGQDYLCCNQLFDWGEGDSKEDIKCITRSEAYLSSVNLFAVKGECYLA